MVLIHLNSIASLGIKWILGNDILISFNSNCRFKEQIREKFKFSKTVSEISILENQTEVVNSTLECVLFKSN